LSPAEQVFTFSIEQKGLDWVVAREGATVSLHPNREQAERAVEWLVDHSVVGPQQAVLFGDLTPRELVVLQRLNQRGSYTEIARELFVSTNTMKTHVRNVYSKLGVTNRGSALAAAAVLGLLDSANEASDGGTADNSNGRMGTTADAARKYLAAFAYALSTHDLTRYSRLLRRDARLITPLRTCEGIDAIAQTNQEIIDAVPDVRIEARHVTVDPVHNRAIFECLHSGTLAHPLSTPYGDIPTTGKRFQFASVHVVAFDESGLISEIRRYWDLFGALREQGLTNL
jgi:DNA-binding CsgD family transcriptional regulator/predicted ester cyclase